jgi:hypothetical protein
MPPSWLVDPIPELKRRAAARIAHEIRDRTLLEARMMLDVDDRRIGDIRAGRLQRFSLERLLQCLTRLRLRVEIHVNGTKL